MLRSSETRMSPGGIPCRAAPGRRTASSARVRRGTPWCAADPGEPGQRLGDEPDLAVPVRGGWSIVRSTSIVTPHGPGVQLAAEQEVGGCAGAGDQARPAGSRPLRASAPRTPAAAGPARPRRPRSPGPPGGRSDVPAGAERPAHPEHRSRARRRAAPRLTAPTARIVCTSVPSPRSDRR